jgi:phosphoglycolate phosphatase-like HAD superfamily hydrolase
MNTATSYSVACCTLSLHDSRSFFLKKFSICGNEVMESKPSALPLRMLCEQASLTPQDCIVVGDTTSDSGMARNAKAGLCIGVLTGSGTATQLMETGANVILPHVGDIPDLLQQMGMGPVEKQGDISTDSVQTSRPRTVTQ